MSEAATGVNVLFRHEEESRMPMHIKDMFTHAVSYYADELYHADETTAEWSALLHMIDNNRRDLFNKVMKKKINGYIAFP